MDFRTLSESARAATKSSLLQRVPVWSVLVVAVPVLLIVTLLVSISQSPKSPPPEPPPLGDIDPPPDLAGDVREELFRRYLPVLRLAPRERWHPIGVDSFLVDACLSRRTNGQWGTCSRDETGLMESGLPRGSGVRLDLVVYHTSEGPECYAGDAPAHVQDRPTVYARIWKNDTGRDRDIGYAIQYWFLYYFNDWQNAPNSPTVWQFHEGDWEQITIGLTRDLQPNYAAYSRHCEGARREWPKVPKVLHPPFEPTRPIVYVARGSHANYFGPGEHRGASKCLEERLEEKRVPAEVLRLLERPIHQVDVAGDGRTLGAEGGQPLELVVLDERPRLLAYQGEWGEGNFVRWTPRVGDRRTRRIDDSPRGPAQQRRPWEDPVELTRNAWPSD